MQQCIKLSAWHLEPTHNPLGPKGSIAPALPFTSSAVLSPRGRPLASRHSCRCPWWSFPGIGLFQMCLLLLYYNSLSQTHCRDANPVVCYQVSASPHDSFCARPSTLTKAAPSPMASPGLSWWQAWDALQATFMPSNISTPWVALTDYPVWPPK